MHVARDNTYMHSNVHNSGFKFALSFYVQLPKVHISVVAWCIGLKLYTSLPSQWQELSLINLASILPKLWLLFWDLENLHKVLHVTTIKAISQLNVLSWNFTLVFSVINPTTGTPACILTGLCPLKILGGKRQVLASACGALVGIYIYILAHFTFW